MNTRPRSLGSWPNAPLALVVTQVRFLPNSDVVAPSKVAERIQERFGGHYSDLANLRAESIVIGPPGSAAAPPPNAESLGFDLRDSADTELVRMQAESLTFITSAYQDSKQFALQWGELMEALCESGSVRVTRIGLRTVDFILPSAEHEPEDYFIEGFGRSPKALGAQSPIAFQLYDYDRGNRGRLRIQYGRGYGIPALPPDLQDTVLPPAHLTSQNNVDLSAVLDMDRWQANNDHMKADRINSEIEKLHVDLRQSFHALMSPLAIREWQSNDALEEA